MPVHHEPIHQSPQYCPTEWCPRTSYPVGQFDTDVIEDDSTGHSEWAVTLPRRTPDLVRTTGTKGQGVHFL